jgi:dTDP-4-amino-4,6-dideoxygalactose transaminase
MSSSVFIATHPNFEADDNKLVNKLLFSRKEWNNYSHVKTFEESVGKFFKQHAFGLDSARSALYLYLRSLQLPPGSEVILPAFSCMVISNAVKWAGFKPVFVDCNPKDFNYALQDLRKKISDRTKVVLIQHTFGFPEDIDAVRDLVGKDVLIVEDLAHSLGGQKNYKLLGTLGDATILTFGIEKVISSIRGGMLLVKDPVLAKKIENEVTLLPAFPAKKVFVALLGSVLWRIATPVYYLGSGKITVGRMLVFLAHKLGLMGNMIEDCEYASCKPGWLPSKMSPALAILGMNQFAKLTRLNKHRAEIAQIYSENLGVKYSTQAGDFVTYLRFPLIVDEPAKLIREAKEAKIVLGDWYKRILYAQDKTLKLLGYPRGSCPVAEDLAKKIVNLPTHINLTKKDALRICGIVK